MSKHVPKLKIGDSVRAMRRKVGINQGELADKAGINRSYLSMIENGKSNPTMDVIENLAHGLGVNPSVLMNAIASTERSEPKHFEYDTEHEFEMYQGLKDFLGSKEELLMMNPSEEEIEWLKSGRFGRNYQPSKEFFRQLLIAHRKSRD